MKTVVVYYSLDGSTRLTAHLIGKRYDADVFELEEVKKRSTKPASFMAAGFAAVTGKKSRLKDDYASRMGAYDTVYIGSPIWASRLAPAVNTFLAAFDPAGKDITVFTLQADRKTVPPKSMDKLTAKLKARGAKSVKVVCLHGQSPGKTASEQHLREQLEMGI